MKHLLPLALISTLLVACGETDSDTSQCHESLKLAIKTDISNATGIANKGKAIDNACSVAFKINDIDYQANLDTAEWGTANEITTVGITEISRFELLQETISFYKDEEDIPGVGDKAIYYNKGGTSELTTLSGDNVIQLSVLNWNDRTYDQSLAIKVTKAMLAQGYPAKPNDR